MTRTTARPDGIGKVVVPEATGGFPFSLAVVGLTALLLVATVGANVLVDPRAEFGTGRFVPLVPDWPMAKLDGYDALDPAPEILILGTSRGMDVPAPVGFENVTFNFAFPGGEVAAMDLILRYAESQDGPPLRVVYLVDQFALRKDPLQKIRDSQAYALLAPDGGEPVPLTGRLGKVPPSLSLGYLQDTYRVLHYTYGPGTPPAGPRFDAQGQLDHAALEDRLEQGSLDQAAAIDDILVRVLQPTFAEGRGVDASTATRFQALVERLAQAGVTVDLVLPPFHPDALPVVRAMPTFAQHHAQVLERALAACGPLVAVHDFTDPASFGASSVHFSDAYHMTPSNGRLLMDAVEAGDHNLCDA